MNKGRELLAEGNEEGEVFVEHEDRSEGSSRDDFSGIWCVKAG